MVALSVLDLVAVREGGTVGEALAETAQLARCAEAAGYHRFWVAEHHAMDGIAGGATAVVLAHVGAATRTIRIGAGGVMLPNHNPFVSPNSSARSTRCSPGGSTWGLAARQGRTGGWDRRCART